MSPDVVRAYRASVKRDLARAHVRLHRARALADRDGTAFTRFSFLATREDFVTLRDVAWCAWFEYVSSLYEGPVLSGPWDEFAADRPFVRAEWTL